MDDQSQQQAFLGVQQDAAPKRHDKGDAASLTDLSNQVINSSRRLRILEERYINLRKKTTVTDSTMLKHYQDIARNLQLINGDILDLQKAVTDIKDKMRLMIREVKNCATAEDLTTLQRYLDFWDPVKFVTYEEVKKIVQEYMGPPNGRRETQQKSQEESQEEVATENHNI
ncbi:hypothetical protein HYS47_04120 [Candidatus Woesearchaeota archaeon]|nr:hypothetical protein [Candidatus Woesearchaeota archaeon]